MPEWNLMLRGSTYLVVEAESFKPQLLIIKFQAKWFEREAVRLIAKIKKGEL